jgi:isopenicillin N synthase-like dioxygenase
MSSHPFQVIDLRAPAEETSRLLLEAANTQGFLFIDGHSFSQQQVDALFRLSMEYFTNTPHHEKLQYAFDVAKNYGYTDYSR